MPNDSAGTVPSNDSPGELRVKPVPRYLPGCLSRGISNKSSSDLETVDPLSHFTADDPNLSLRVLLKTSQSPCQDDANYIKGEVAKRIIQEKQTTGVMPRYRCKRLKITTTRLTLKFHDTSSYEFYLGILRELPPPNPGHPGFLIKEGGDEQPLKTFRAWVPEEMKDAIESIPDFLDIETNNVLNPGNFKILSTSPSLTGPGYMVYCEMDDFAAEYVKAHTSGIMFAAHNLKFSPVFDRPRSAVPGERSRSTDETWRRDSSDSSESLFSQCHAARSPTIFYSPARCPYESRTAEVIIKQGGAGSRRGLLEDTNKKHVTAE